MADKFKLNIISPEKKFLEGDCEFLEFVSTEGELGIYAKHIPLTTILEPCVMRIHNDGQRQARDIQHRGHLVTPQRRNEILECYFHLSNCNFNRFPSSGSHVTRRPARARGSRWRRASCAA